MKTSEDVYNEMKEISKNAYLAGNIDAQVEVPVEDGLLLGEYLGSRLDSIIINESGQPDKLGVRVQFAAPPHPIRIRRDNRP